MIEGYKNREVVVERYERALNKLTEAERNEYMRDGYIMVKDDEGCHVRREVFERVTTRHETRKYGLEQLLCSEFYGVDTTSDGVPFTHFINFDYGLVSIIRFSDGTIHVRCEDRGYYQYLQKYLQGCYELDFHEGFVRFNIKKPITIEDKINKIKQQLNS